MVSPALLICIVVKALMKRGSMRSQDLAHRLPCEKCFCQIVGLIGLPQPLGVVPSLFLCGPQVFQTAGELRPKPQIDRCLESMSQDWRMQSHHSLKLWRVRETLKGLRTQGLIYLKPWSAPNPTSWVNSDTSTLLSSASSEFLEDCPVDGSRINSAWPQTPVTDTHYDLATDWIGPSRVPMPDS